MRRRASAGRRVIVGLILVIALSGCTGEVSSTSSSGQDGSSPVAGGAADTGDVPAVALESLVDGLEQPLDVVTGPDGLLYVAERAGKVRVVEVGGPGARVRERPYLDISDRVSTGNERGLLGIDFAADGGRFFAHYTDRDGASTVSAWQLGSASTPLDSSAERVLLSVDQPFGNHNGGDLAVGPDGHLYIGLGDGGSAGDPLGNGQDPSTLLGAILRIDPSPSDSAPYSIPADNPFADGGDGAPEVWAYGLRNPWRFAFDPSGEHLWIGDVGQGDVEEIDRIAVDRAGANFGWSALEGNQPFDGGAPDDVVAPVYTYPHSEGQSVTGGRVATTPEALDGLYVFGDFVSGFVRALDPADPSTATALPVEVPGLVGFGVGRDGTLLAVSINGVIHRFVAVPEG